MECSAKKGGEDISGDAGIFGKVVDRVRLNSPSLPSLRFSHELLLTLPPRSTQIVDTPSLYTKSLQQPTTSNAAGKKRADGGKAPPGGFPGGRQTVSLDDEMSGEGGSWCAC